MNIQEQIVNGILVKTREFTMSVKIPWTLDTDLEPINTVNSLNQSSHKVLSDYQKGVNFSFVTTEEDTEEELGLLQVTEYRRKIIIWVYNSDIQKVIDNYISDREVI